MKRVFILMVFTIMAIGASAQVTYNVRAGIGGMDVKSDDYVYNFYNKNSVETIFSYGVMAQANIPFNKYGKFSFSPTVLFLTDMDYEELYIPLLLGYKIGIGHKKLFFPKIGASLVYADYHESLLGITTDLAFELNHLVVGVFGCYSLNCDYGSCIFATIGYKF